MSGKISILLITLNSVCSVYAQSDTSLHAQKIVDMKSLELKAYGELLYRVYNWETYPDKNNDIDLYEVVFAPTYHFSPKVELEMEIEFEHGGTGSTMEFDRFEEFGEFEQEIEKGGEIIIEEFELAYEHKDWLEIKAGKLKIPVGFVSQNDEPLEYLSTTFNNVEQTLIPTPWYGYGIGLEGEFKNIEYQIVCVNALDNSQFSSANWIQRGGKERFETISADAFAVASRLDYVLSDESSFGVSGYIGNSTPNRPKEDMTEPAYVSCLDGHINLQLDGIKINALVFYGMMQNADIVSDQNRNLSNNLNAKRTPIGSDVLGYFGEIGYDIFSLTQLKSNYALDVFAGYYYYDSMYKTTGDVFNNPRWERNELRTGFSLSWNKHLALKSDITLRTIGIPENNNETTFTTALAFQF